MSVRKCSCERERESEFGCVNEREREMGKMFKQHAEKMSTISRARRVNI